ncbi:hypothetical protein LTR47_008717 [Exophiala xenobiotica]|nr:hypothetical protein LTR47_008717 [Exophiala xenobiotica]KAK5251862.1 hypothetical protein LTS06_003597 [Exophiala xenobiotica]KAK5346459.1 hypothetical protein LTR61_009900 [Exophiala xenobiotica]KAK5360108.1 hypothetical protein LTR11_010394 [Exophiala xenobiotica]KAK5376357.1 hypothetical protein LTS03_005125 [Exophiala xenobiotica]
MAFTSAPMDDLINPNFCLTSSNGSRRYPGSNTSTFSSAYYPDNDEFMMSASSAMNYPSLTAQDNSFALAVTPSHGGFATDPVYEFLTDDALSENSFAEMNLVSSQYSGQNQTQDMMNPGYMPADLSPYDSGMMTNTNAYPVDMPFGNLPLTPPPEEQVHQELYQQQCLSGKNFLDDSYHMDRDIPYYEANNMSRTCSYSPPRRNVILPRPIRSASERDGAISESSSHVHEIRTPRDEPSGDKLKARTDPLYDAKPDSNGFYHCPMSADHKCPSHAPTKQKCIYNKYLDSHLRPYKCKFADRPECEDARFSSNACLFRHEREAHGLHNHGLNPFLCKFPECDRSKDGNGFPRRWNQRDHMKRVHEYDEKDLPRDRITSADQAKRRKTQGSATSAPMKRSGSSAYAKVQVIAGVALNPRHGRVVNQARYNAPAVYSTELKGCNMMTSPMGNVQYSNIPTMSRCLPSRSKAYPG